MNKIFGIDTKFSRVMAKAWSLIVLNILTVLCMLPVVTIGASLTAMHYVQLKLVRNEEGYVSAMFFKAFKENFKNATILWFFEGVLLLSFWMDWKLFPAKAVHWVVLIAAIVILLLLRFAYPLMSHFENTLLMTLKNSAILCIARFPRTLGMLLVWVVPYEILTHSLVLFPVVLLLGISLPGYVCAKLYDPVFEMLEPAPLAEEGGTDLESTVS